MSPESFLSLCLETCTTPFVLEGAKAKPCSQAEPSFRLAVDPKKKKRVQAFFSVRRRESRDSILDPESDEVTGFKKRFYRVDVELGQFQLLYDCRFINRFRV